MVSKALYQKHRTDNNLSARVPQWWCMKRSFFTRIDFGIFVKLFYKKRNCLTSALLLI